MNTIILGCGLISGRWIRTLSADPRITVAALVDGFPDTAIRIAEKCGLAHVPWFPNLDAALDAVQAKIIVNLTPTDSHAHYTRMALEHRLHVFTEKPLALCLDEAQELTQLARSAGLVLGVMNNRGHDARFLEVRDLIHGLGPGPYVVSADMFVHLPAPGFRPRLPYPALQDLAVHAFDQIGQIIHADPTSLICRETPLPRPEGHCTSASVTVRYSDDSVFNFQGGFSGLGHKTSADGHWRVDTPKAGCRWGGLDTVEIFYDRSPDQPSAVHLRTPSEGHGPRITAMIDAVYGGPPLPDGLGSAALLDAAQLSISTGRPVEVRQVRPWG
ncbi:Predicted dehydrogenase [Sinosporangium album]|uniref:Predicted dehydrogenase n=1 Tax=Sinosporangium album TaxID=504805 RepID=A0A1G8KYB0_9ACTN|nr:Gfo/Idh/MocA family oxidoreductase [Sinosporangium album]SDI48414.1 Predicted dehydrogenase [Sinosporangium album]